MFQEPILDGDEYSSLRAMFSDDTAIIDHRVVFPYVEVVHSVIQNRILPRSIVVIEVLPVILKSANIIPEASPTARPLKVVRGSVGCKECSGK